MEVLVYEDTKEVEANFALEDDLSAVIVKKKRRVSFAQTQTIHVIPRHDDIETPPLLNSDPLFSNANTFSAAPRFSADLQSGNPRVSTTAHDHPLHDDSSDSTHFTSDMDTGHGSWADDDSQTQFDSADGLEDESGCFVHLRHISHLESDDSIVNEVLHDDMTMDATTFSRNLSHFLKSGTTFDLQEASHPGAVAKLMKDCDAQSEESSMALTKTGAPHQALINPQDVSIHGDDDKSDMSLATGSDRERPKKRGNLSKDDKLSVSNATEKPQIFLVWQNISYIKVDKAEEEYMVQPPPIKLQTLCDYLEFSCNTQPQVDWLNEHIQELEVKLVNAKKRNTEVMSCNASTQLQKLSEESFYASRSKFASMHSLAKKGWILWKLDAQRQVLSLLRESKENLMKEVEDANIIRQQVMDLKELYSQLAPPKVEFDKARCEAVHNSAPTKGASQGEEKARGASSQSIELKDRHHLYQEACDQLSHLKIKWSKIQIKVESVESVHSQRLQSEKDEVSFENDLKASMRKLAFTNSLLQQQQVMQLKVKNSGRKSVIDLSLRGMYLQSFQFECDNPTAKVQISKSLHPEEIEMVFPCMEACLFFEYFSSDHYRAPMELQHLYRIIQRSNYIFGCWMDVLKEIKFCRRNFGITCKFQIVNGDFLLSVTFLQCQSGISARLMFDMACARGGAYPFDRNPADVQIQTFGLPASESISQSDMILTIGGIQPGFGRLARICSYVEKTIAGGKELVLD